MSNDPRPVTHFVGGPESHPVFQRGKRLTMAKKPRFWSVEVRAGVRPNLDGGPHVRQLPFALSWSPRFGQLGRQLRVRGIEFF